MIDNPASGETIVIRRSAADTGGLLLEFELSLAPGARVPSAHSHPEQEESFHILEGQVRFRLGPRRLVLAAGETLVVPARTVHSFVNPGPQTARLMVRVTPALEMQQLLETAAAMSSRTAGRRISLPNPLELALFARRFEREVSAPMLPRTTLRLAVTPLAWLARRLGVAMPERGDAGRGSPRDPDAVGSIPP